MLIETVNGISLHRIFKKTILVDTLEPSHIYVSQKSGHIEVQYVQYRVIDSVNEVIPETIIARTYFVKDNPDILAPDRTILLPSKMRFTNWCNYVTPYPLQAFFRAVVNDTLISYPNLPNDSILPDYSDVEIQTALDDWNSTHS
jgi:hypothetical protein